MRAGLAGALAPLCPRVMQPGLLPGCSGQSLCARLRASFPPGQSGRQATVCLPRPLWLVAQPEQGPELASAWEPEPEAALVREAEQGPAVVWVAPEPATRRGPERELKGTESAMEPKRMGSDPEPTERLE